MYSNDREAYRQMFFTTWQKYLNKSPLAATESQLLDIILVHPQYHDLLDAQFQTQEFVLEENPFLHMSLHLAIREQISTDRPKGVREVYQRLLQTDLEIHEVEHEMMGCLAEIIWNTQQTGTPANEAEYLQKLLSL